MWLLREGVSVLKKKEPLHDLKAGALAAVAAALQQLPVRNGEENHESYPTHRLRLFTYPPAATISRSLTKG